MNNLNKCVSILLATIIVGTFSFFNPPKSQAANPISSAICDAYNATIGKLVNKGEQKLDEFTGNAVDKGVSAITGGLTAVPVSDVTTHSGQQSQIANDQKTDCEHFVNNVVLSALKHRLLTEMTNEIVDWINGNGSPKFTQNFGQVFRDAGDKAIGDVLQQIGNGELCKPFAFNIQFQLQQQQTLQQQTTCSLSSVINNIDSFSQNFANGGWVGYNELLKPQNNQTGVELITQSALFNATVAKTNESVLQQQVNVGFSSEQCTQWTLYDARTNNPALIGTPYKPNFSTTQSTTFKVTKGDQILTAPPASDDPNKPPSAPFGDINFFYKCTHTNITTPGSTLAAGLEQATYGKDFNFIINSQDLSDTIGVIADAAFNKLIQNGVKGLQDFTSKALADKSRQSAEGNQTYNQAEQDSGYQNSQDQVLQNARNGYLNELSPVTDALTLASSTLFTASSTNETIISASGALLACGNNSDATFAKNSMDIASSTTRQTIKSKLTQVGLAVSNTDALAQSISGANASQLSQANSFQQSISNAVSTASALSDDANNILTSTQSTLNEIQTRQNSDCNTQNK